jgi:hypothetical protein
MEASQMFEDELVHNSEDEGRIALKRANADWDGGMVMEDDDEDEVADVEVLDLEEYFDSFGVPDEERVKMCRGYATYVASKIPVVKKK